MKKRLRVLAALMSLSMVFTMMPMMGQTAYADDPAPPAPAAICLVQDGTASNIVGAQKSYIWFGKYKQSGDGSGDFNNEPVMWRVLSNGKGQILLLSDQNLDCKPYHEQFAPITWAESTIRGWLNNVNDGFMKDAFSEDEQKAIATTKVHNQKTDEYIPNPDYQGGGDGADTQDQVFLLSIGDARNTNYGFTSDFNGTETRKAKNTVYALAHGAQAGFDGGGDWWLRSPGYGDRNAAVVNDSGGVHSYGYLVDYGRIAVRPALNINPESVIFTSAAVDGKLSGAVGAGALQPLGSNSTNEWKLTVKDDARKDFKVDSVTSCDGKTLTIKYSKAAAGDGDYISAIIVSPGGEVKYYGKLAPASKQDGATTKVDIEGKMESDDTLYVFNEQCNDDYETDFASPLQAITKTADHAWDGGKVTKEPTVTATGIRTYTCTVCKATKTEPIAKLPDPTKQYGTDGTPVGPGASYEAADRAITNTTSDKDIKGAKFAPLKLKSSKQGKKSIQLSWTKNKKAVKYVVYGNRCNAKGKKYKPVKLATVTGGSCKVKKIGKAALKKGNYYKFVLVALDKNNKVVSTSKMIHVATQGGKVGNHKKVTTKAKIKKNGKASKKYLSLSSTKVKKGKSLKIKATMTPAKKKLKVKKHVGVRFESSKPKVATVSRSGKITAKKKGSCYIYAYAQNGVAKRIKITVK